MGLQDDPFEYRITKSGLVQISRGGQQVVTVAGPRAEQLIAKLGVDDDTDQQLLARATGNYRRGNERQGKQRGR